jgi:hypothetical protein
VHISEDFPSVIQERRKQLQPVLNAAYRHGDRRARLVVDKLIINGRVYTVDTIDRLPEHLQPSLLASPSQDDTLVFFTKASPLSNHYPCKFVVDKTQYNCMEQFLMNAKALHFSDTHMASKIMGTSDPVAQKGFGKQVVDFDRQDWQNVVPDILNRGVLAKFTQDITCKEFLQNTGVKIIGEANPNDRFFGIGIRLGDDNVWNRDRWAHNLLGKCLMEVRNEL